MNKISRQVKICKPVLFPTVMLGNGMLAMISSVVAVVIVVFMLNTDPVLGTEKEDRLCVERLKLLFLFLNCLSSNGRAFLLYHTA